MFTLFRQLRARLKYRHFDRDLTREIDTHRAMKQEELETAGVPPADASAATSRALGNVTLMREDARGIWIGRWLREARQDTRYALTTFRRQPGFCVAVIAILGIGLGLVTTAHALVDATFLRPWQVPNGRDVYFVRSMPTSGGDFGQMSLPELRYLRDHARTVDHLAATHRSGRVRVFYSDAAFDLVPSLEVSANYFDLLGVRMVAGRPFLPAEDDHATRVPVAVIGERLWTDRFGRDPAVVGRAVRIGREMHTIVGVAPDSFLDPHDSKTGFWRPFSLRLTTTADDARAYADPKHRTFPYAIVAKLSDGKTPQQASVELSGLSRQFRESAGIPVYGHQLRDTRPGNSDLGVAMLVLGALVLIQLVACANVGNLVLARSISRQRELAVRLSLGAGRSRLVRQLVTEVMVLSACAAIVGVGLAYLIPSVGALFLPEEAPRGEFYWPNAFTLMVALGLSVVTALAAGLAPALRATRVSLSVITSERHGPTLSTTRLRRLLLATQVAVAALLLAGAGIFTRAVAHASGGDPGFPMREFLEVSIEFPAGSQGPRRIALFAALKKAVESGGWPPMAFINDAPILARNNWGFFLRAAPDSTPYFFRGRRVSDNYFDLIGVPLVAGRMSAADHEVVLNRAAAERLLPGESPVGRSLIASPGSRDRVTNLVVGVAPDLPSGQINRIDPVVYTHVSFFDTNVIVKTRDTSIVDRFNEILARLDPGVTATARPWEETLDEALLVPRIGSWVAWTIGGIGLVLAMIGAFGVFAHAVEERRREIGIRLALGAESSQVVRLIVARTQGSVAIGVSLGLGLAAAGAAVLRGFLYGLSPFDPVAYLQVAAILGIAAAVATWIPASRATRVNPAETLRAD
jgi:putative ABC transport system permease protein